MIRINLLPLDERKQPKRFTLPTFSGTGPLVIWMAVVGVAYFGTLFAIGSIQARNTKSLEKKIEEAKEESTRLAPQLEKIRKLTKEREEVNKRLGIIASLDRERYFRVQLLNDLSMKLPRNCWLTSVSEQSGRNVSIEGVTFSNYIIADLMSNLENSDRFQQVFLSIAQEGRMSDHRVIQFTLESTIAP